MTGCCVPPLRMWIALLSVALCSGAHGAALAPQEISLFSGQVIDRSVVVRARVYQLPSGGLDRPPIRIAGENITVDFNGAVLEGRGTEPDSYTGVGILIDGGRNITVKNAVVRGYKVGILARRSLDLHLSGNDFSYNGSRFARKRRPI